MNPQQALDLELLEADQQAMEALRVHGELTFRGLQMEGVHAKTIEGLIQMGIFEEFACGRFRLRPISAELQMMAEGAQVAIYEGGRLLCIEPVAFVGEEIVAVRRGGRLRRFLLRGGWLLELSRMGSKRIKPAEEADFQLLEAMRCARRLERCDWELMPVETLRRLVAVLDEVEAGGAALAVVRGEDVAA